MSTLLTLSAAINLAFGLLALNRRFQFSRYAGGMFIAYAIYQYGYAMELQSRTLSEMLFWSNAQYLAIPFFPVIWVFFMLGVTSPLPVRMPRWSKLLWGVPLAMILLKWTNDWHGLYYVDPHIVLENSRYLLAFGHGPAYVAMMVFHFTSAGFTTLLLLRHLRRGKRFHPFVVTTLTIINVAPFVVLAVYLISGILLDLSPFVACLTGPLFAIALYRFRVFQLSPVGRETIFENMETGVLVLDLGKRIVDYNKALVNILYSSQMEPLGKKVLELHPDFSRLPLPPIDMQGSLQVEYTQSHPEWGEQHFSVNISSLPHRLGWTLVFYETTARKELEERLRFLSFHDALTGLYNRTYFEEEVQRTGLGRQFPVGIISIDLDGLKAVNDTQGHEAGDAMLRATGDLLLANLRKDEIAARVGGDEFLILLRPCNHEQLAIVYNRLRSAFTDAFTDNGIRLAASVGCALADSPQQIADAMKLADEAMYREKRLHKQLALVSPGTSDETLDLA